MALFTEAHPRQNWKPQVHNWLLASVQELIAILLMATVGFDVMHSTKWTSP
jgi:hypothetical protein